MPANRVDQVDVDEIKQWAEFAGNQCVWLKLGNQLQAHFSGSEVDHCIAGDFNFTTDGSSTIGPRSELGEAEFQLKYHQYPVLTSGVFEPALNYEELAL